MNRPAPPPRTRSRKGRRLRALALASASASASAGLLLLSLPSDAPPRHPSVPPRGLRASSSSSSSSYSSYSSYSSHSYSPPDADPTARDAARRAVAELPPPPATTARRAASAPKPGYLRACEGLLSRRYAAASGQDELLGTVWDVAEDPSVCGDWGRGHESVMGMFAAEVVANVGASLNIKYEHGCGKWSAGGGGEHCTTIQQVLPEFLIGDAVEVDRETVGDLCRECIAEYQDQHPTERRGADPLRQCIILPDPSSPSEPILTKVLASVRDGIKRAAGDYLYKAESEFVDLKEEARTGVVVFLDDTSTFMDYSVYERSIPRYTTRVQILASAKCAIASERGESTCLDQGERLRAYLRRRGENGAAVRYDVIGSTAAALARMVNAHRLVCPPGTVSCFLPSLAKSMLTSSVIAESTKNAVGRGWFDEIGALGSVHNVVVIELTEGETDMPLSVIVADQPSADGAAGLVAGGDAAATATASITSGGITDAAAAGGGTLVGGPAGEYPDGADAESRAEPRAGESARAGEEGGGGAPTASTGEGTATGPGGGGAKGAAEPMASPAVGGRARSDAAPAAGAGSVEEDEKVGEGKGGGSSEGGSPDEPAPAGPAQAAEGREDSDAARGGGEAEGEGGAAESPSAVDGGEPDAESGSGGAEEEEGGGEEVEVGEEEGATPPAADAPKVEAGKGAGASEGGGEAPEKEATAAEGGGSP